MRMDFLCVGFAKGGTTTLDALLRQHRDIVLPVIKETKFLCRKDLYAKGIEWYEKRFFGGAYDEAKKIGEIDVGLTGGFYAKRIKQNFGDEVKLIFMMRNPVDCLFSHFKMNLLYGRYIINGVIDNRPSVEMAFAKCVRDNIKYSGRDRNPRLCNFWPIASYGKYSMSVANYMKYFRASNIKFVIFEEFIKDQERYTREIFDFLGVDCNYPINYKVKANEGNRKCKNKVYAEGVKIIDQVLWQWLLPRVSYENTPTLMKFYNKLFKIFTVTVKTREKHLVAEDARRILEDYYRQDKERLELCIDRDLSDLWFK